MSNVTVFAEVPVVDGGMVSLESGDADAAYWLTVDHSDGAGATAHLTVRQLEHLYIEIGHALSR